MCVVREWLFKASVVSSRVFVPKAALFFYQYYATGWTLYRFCTLWLQRSFVLWQQDGRNKCPTNSISFWSNQIFFQPVIYSISAWLFVFMRRNRLEPGGFKVNIRDRQTITYFRHLLSTSCHSCFENLGHILFHFNFAQQNTVKTLQSQSQWVLSPYLNILRA